MTYEEYLRTEHWDQLRLQCREKHKGECAICASRRRPQTHHWRYRANWFDTELSDLVLLCEACHAMVHRHGAQTLSPEQLISRYRDRFTNQPPRVHRKPKKQKKRKAVFNFPEMGTPFDSEDFVFL